MVFITFNHPNNLFLLFASILAYFIGFIATIIINILQIIYLENYTEFPQGLVSLDFYSICKNNLKVISFLLLGAFLLGSITLVNLFANGFIFSTMIYLALQKGLSLNEIIALTLPHGIFEIPAIILAGAAGFKIPYEIIRYLAGRKEQILTKEDIKEYLTLALISIVLIVIAAWIEANVTLRIAKAMLKTKGI